MRQTHVLSYLSESIGFDSERFTLAMQPTSTIVPLASTANTAAREDSATVEPACSLEFVAVATAAIVVAIAAVTAVAATAARTAPTVSVAEVVTAHISVRLED